MKEKELKRQIRQCAINAINQKTKLNINNLVEFLLMRSLSCLQHIHPFIKDKNDSEKVIIGKIVQWSRMKGFEVKELENQTSVVTPLFSIEFSNGKMTFGGLGSTHTLLYNINNIDVSIFEKYVDALPSVLAKFHEDEAYILQNYEAIALSVQKQERVRELKQVSIESAVTVALKNQYDYDFERLPGSVNVFVDFGDNCLLYPIPNRHFAHMKPVLANLSKAIHDFQKKMPGHS